MKKGKRRSGSGSSGFLCFSAETSDEESDVKPPPVGDGRNTGSSEDGKRRHHNGPNFRRVLTKIFRSSSVNRNRKELKRLPSPPGEPISLYKQYEKFSRQSTEVDDRKSVMTISTSSFSDTSSLTSSSSTSSTSSSSAVMALVAGQAAARAEHMPPRAEHMPPRAELVRPRAENVPPRAPKAQMKAQRPTSAAKPIIPLPQPPLPPALFRKFSPATRIAFLLVTALMLLLLFGRIGATVLTSLLLFYVARRNYRPAADKRSAPTPRVVEERHAAPRRLSEGGEDRKKKVVMEGFLNRNRRSLN